MTVQALSAADRHGLLGRASQALACFLIAAAASAQPVEPAGLIGRTADRLASRVAETRSALRREPAAQRALVDELLRPVFDLETSSALILRSAWTEATPVKRRQFVDAFYDYLVASYGDALHYVNERTFTLLPDQPPVVADRYRVRTRLVMHDGESFELQFYLRKDGDRWSIVDVIVDGVSYLRTYRADFGSLLRAEGLDGLIRWLEEAAGEKLDPA